MFGINFVFQERILSTDVAVEFTDDEERNIPPMVMNTFGLDYGRIMNQVSYQLR